MKNSTKALTVVAAIGLLVAMFGLTTLFSAVDVEEDEVEWTMENGDDLAFVKADETYDFYIEDDALETIVYRDRPLPVVTLRRPPSSDVANQENGLLPRWFRGSRRGLRRPRLATTVSEPKRDAMGYGRAADREGGLATVFQPSPLTRILGVVTLSDGKPATP